MGNGAIVDASGLLQMLDAEGAKPYDARDVDTPRGVSAKDEVQRLRNVISEQRNKQTLILAMNKFKELDVDKSGFLEGPELEKVVDYVLSFGNYDSSGLDKDEIHKSVMARVDENLDGRLDLEEFLILFEEELRMFALTRRAKLKFLELDVDSSGFLEQKEIEEVVNWIVRTEKITAPDEVETAKSRVLKRVMAVDADYDGKLSLEEFTVLYREEMFQLDTEKRASQKFKELDINGNGVLDKDEILKVVDWMLRLSKSNPNRIIELSKKNIMAAIDDNKDGKLELGEFLKLYRSAAGEKRSDENVEERARQKFAELDADKSGFLEKNELNEVVKWMFALKEMVLGDRERLKKLVMKNVDENANGTIELVEFIALFQREMRVIELLNRAGVRFRLIDPVNAQAPLSALPDIISFMQKTIDVPVAGKKLVKGNMLKAVEAVFPDAPASTLIGLQDFITIFEEVMYKIPVVRNLNSGTVLSEEELSKASAE